VFKDQPLDYTMISTTISVLDKAEEKEGDCRQRTG